MAIIRSNRNEGYAELTMAETNLLALGQTQVRVRIAVSQSVPSLTDSQTTTNESGKYQDGTVDVSWRISGGSNLVAGDNRDITVGVKVVQDDTDTGGGSTGVDVYQELTTGQITLGNYAIVGVPDPDNPLDSSTAAETGTTTVSVPKEGSYKIVLVCHNNAGNPPASSNVDTGLTSTDYYIDSDGYTVAGTLASLQSSADRRASSWCRVVSTPQSLTTNISPQRYGHTPTISGDISNGTLINPKRIRVSAQLKTDSVINDAPVDIFSITPSTVGAFTTGTYNVDTGYATNPTDYELRLGVGAMFGQTSTPTNEQPDFWSNVDGGGNTYGTISVSDTNDRAWCIFDASSLYPLDDSSGNNYGLTNVNGVTFTPKFTGFGDSAEFTRSLDNYLVNDVINVNSGDAFTIETKINFKDFSNDIRIFGEWDNPTPANSKLFLAYSFTNSRFFFRYYRNDGTLITHIPATMVFPGGNTANVNHDFAVTYDGSNLRFFFDGTLQSTLSENNLRNTKVSDFRIGDYNTGTGSIRMHGFIDEFRISDNSRYSVSYTPATTPFTTDANTEALYHFESTVIAENPNIYIGDTVSIHSGFDVFKDAGVTSGIGSFSEATYTNVNRLFRRVNNNNDLTEEYYCTPYLQTYIYDKSGNPINNVRFDFNTHDTGSTTLENNGVKTTDANGRVRHNYTIARTHKAFNRSKEPYNTIDNASSPPLAVPIADIQGNNPLTGQSGVVPAFDLPRPAYPKEVRVLGKAFGSDNPSLTVTEVFGVNSEPFAHEYNLNEATQIIYMGRSTVDDANDAPLGVFTNVIPLGTGSLKTKAASEINLTTGLIEDVARSAIRDTANRQIDVSVNARRWRGARVLYNLTLESIEIPKETLGVQGRMQGALGYPADFRSISAPSDPSLMRLTLFYHDQDVAINLANINVTDGDSFGWTADVGNYGVWVQDLQFIVVDPDLIVALTIDSTRSETGSERKYTAAINRFLPGTPTGLTLGSATKRILIAPDDPLQIHILKSDGAGLPFETVLEDVMTSIDGISYEYFYTPDADGVYKAFVTGYTQGSRPPDAGSVSLIVEPQIAVQVTGAGITSGGGNHAKIGDLVAVGLWAINTTDNEIAEIDSSLIVVRRVLSTGTEYLDGNGDWITEFGNEPAYTFSLVEISPNTNVYAALLPSNAITTDNDLYLNGVVTIGGKSFNGQGKVEILGNLNRHGLNGST